MSQLQGIVVLQTRERALTPKERISVLSLMGDTGVNSLDYVVLHEVGFKNVSGYVSESLMKCMGFDLDEIGDFITELVSGGVYSPELWMYEFHDHAVMVIEQAKLHELPSREDVEEILLHQSSRRKSKSKPDAPQQNQEAVTHLPYKLIVKRFAEEFIQQYFEDFLLTLLRNPELTLKQYFIEIFFNEECKAFFQNHDLEILEAMQLDKKALYDKLRNVRNLFIHDASIEIQKQMRKECLEKGITLAESR